MISTIGRPTASHAWVPVPAGEGTGELGSAIPGEVVVSQIQGMFKGWDGRTTFDLKNGQVWRQEDFHCLYRFAYEPRVAIVPAGSGHEMRVEGVQGTVRVRRVK